MRSPRVAVENFSLLVHAYKDHKNFKYLSQVITRVVSLYHILNDYYEQFAFVLSKLDSIASEEEKSIDNEFKKYDNETKEEQRVSPDNLN